MAIHVMKCRIGQFLTFLRGNHFHNRVNCDKPFFNKGFWLDVPALAWGWLDLCVCLETLHDG
jgi:hypothetical protein